MENALGELISPIDEKISQFQGQNSEFFRLKTEELCALKEIVSELNNSWSGSWIGFHSNLYIQNFEKIPSWKYAFNSEWGSVNEIPEYWQEKNYDDVLSYVNKRAKGLNFKTIFKQVQQKLVEIKRIQKILTTDLVILRDNPSFSTEVEVLDKLIKHRWGASVHELNEVTMPKQFMTRDSFALQQGIRTPPHIYFENEIISELSKIQSIEEFLDLAQGLIRQIEVKIKYRPEKSQEDSIITIQTIIERFHQVSRQLRNRYNNRETMKIEDEYDVQDLLHSLLKIFFDDIRTEEWTPQYAGGASRMDFLLKDEKIVIEVKKTRASLLEKQIGEQLILDVVKYKQHQDCKILFCFIYDPEGRIGNPTGLEKDLNQMTTDDLRVIVKIAPS